MPPFKVVTPAGVSFGPPDAGYDGEMEALATIGAEIVEIPAGSGLVHGEPSVGYAAEGRQAANRVAIRRGGTSADDEGSERDGPARLGDVRG